MLGRTAEALGIETPERVIAPQAREPHGRQRNPFDKRFCPALWLERAFLDGNVTGVISHKRRWSALRGSGAGLEWPVHSEGMGVTRPSGWGPFLSELPRTP